MNHGTDTWVAGSGSLFAGEKHYPFWIFFPTTPFLSTATENFRSPNTMSLVTSSRGKVKFSSSLNDSHIISG